MWLVGSISAYFQKTTGTATYNFGVLQRCLVHTPGRWGGGFLFPCVHRAQWYRLLDQWMAKGHRLGRILLWVCVQNPDSIPSKSWSCDPMQELLRKIYTPSKARLVLFSNSSSRCVLRNRIPSRRTQDCCLKYQKKKKNLFTPL